MSNRSKELEEIRLYIETLDTEEQNAHSHLLNTLQNTIGRTFEFENVAKVLREVLNAKLGILEKIRKKIQTYG